MVVGSSAGCGRIRQHNSMYGRIGVYGVYTARSSDFKVWGYPKRQQAS